MGQGVLLTSGAADIDFMVHGVFSYELFGQTIWITTTHVCVLIVMLVIIGFCIAANRAVKHATDVPGTFQNIVEMVVEMLDNMIGGVMGKFSPKFRNYIRTVRLETADGGLRRDAGAGPDDVHADSFQQI